MVCGVDHDDLNSLNIVSKSIREAVSSINSIIFYLIDFQYILIAKFDTVTEFGSKRVTFFI